eukprot:1195757-Prorocentrum_minimum.AAC.6
MSIVNGMWGKSHEGAQVYTILSDQFKGTLSICLYSFVGLTGRESQLVFGFSLCQDRNRGHVCHDAEDLKWGAQRDD